MDNYINLLRCIFKNFDNEFDDIIKNIIDKIFDEYYIKRNQMTYCLDNLYKKFNADKYDFIVKKYGIVKNKNLIYRFTKTLYY